MIFVLKYSELVKVNVNIFVVDHKVYSTLIPFISYLVMVFVMYLLRYVL